MATITVTLPEGVTLSQGKQISFTAPCDSTGVTGIIINNVTYTLLKANGESLETGAFISGALISVLIDLTNHKAYIQNNAEVNVQSDWNVTDDTSDAYIKNKPTLSTPADTTTTLSDPVKTVLAITGTKYVSDALTKLSGAALRKVTYTQLSTLADGTEFSLNETIGGTTTAVTFIKLKNNYQSSGRVLVIRKNAIATTRWNSTNNNAYSNSVIDTYMNTTYVGYLDSAVQTVLSNVNIPYTIGNGTVSVTTLPRKCFALSFTEYGLTQNYASTEGTAITHFSTADARICYTDAGVACAHWTRSPYTGDTGEVHDIGATGAWSVDWATAFQYARPAFTLPADFETNPTNTITDMSGNEFVLPQYAKIATGSYTGTGTYGSSNPNSVTFPFAVKEFSICGTGESTVEGSNYLYPVCVDALSTSYALVHRPAFGGTYSLVSSTFYMKKSVDGKTIYWYDTASAANHFNISTRTYYCTAKG